MRLINCRRRRLAWRNLPLSRPATATVHPMAVRTHSPRRKSQVQRVLGPLGLRAHLQAACCELGGGRGRVGRSALPEGQDGRRSRRGGHAGAEGGVAGGQKGEPAGVGGGSSSGRKEPARGLVSSSQELPGAVSFPVGRNSPFK